MRTRIVTLISAVVVVGVLQVVQQAPAGADPAPWTWVQVSASANAQVNQTVTVTCPTGYSAITGGWAYSTDGLSIKDVTIAGPRYSVDAGDGGYLSVTAWCAQSSQVDITIVHQTLTVTASGNHWRGYGDYACGSGMTPLSASLNWTRSPLYTLQSGPETIGGVNEWFVAVRGSSSAASMDVRLSCVADSDLNGATWVSQPVKNTGGSNSIQTTTAACPAQQRILTGGEHIDSLVAATYASIPSDGQTWSARADLPPGDTLTVLVLCAPDGDPVATFTGHPSNPTNSATATFTFTALDPAGGSAQNYCFVNTNYLGPCNGSYTVTSLPEGQNVFSIEALTPDGRGGASTEKDYYFFVDLTPPTVTLGRVRLFTLTRNVTVQAGGTDNQGLGYYSLHVTTQRSSGAGAGGTSPVTQSLLSDTGAETFAVKPGTSYRVSAQSVDQAHNVSLGTAIVRTAVPLDNFALHQSAQWSLLKGRAYTHGEISSSVVRGSTLTHTMYGNTLGIVATTCPRCGRIGVYSGRRLLKKIRLTSSSVHHRRIVTVTLHKGHPIQAKITLKVLSSRKLVQIDGLGAVLT